MEGIVIEVYYEESSISSRSSNPSNLWSNLQHLYLFKMNFTSGKIEVPLPLLHGIVE